MTYFPMPQHKPLRNPKDVEREEKARAEKKKVDELAGGAIGRIRGTDHRANEF